MMATEASRRRPSPSRLTTSRDPVHVRGGVHWRRFDLHPQPVFERPGGGPDLEVDDRLGRRIHSPGRPWPLELGDPRLCRPQRRSFTIRATATDGTAACVAGRYSGDKRQASLEPEVRRRGEAVQNLNGFPPADYVRYLTVLQPDSVKFWSVRLFAGRHGNRPGPVQPERVLSYLDFGIGGSVVTEFGAEARRRPVVRLKRRHPDAGNFGIARYSANGSLDTAFGNGGRITSFPNIRKAMRVDGSGRILAGGRRPVRSFVAERDGRS